MYNCKAIYANKVALYLDIHTYWYSVHMKDSKPLNATKWVYHYFDFLYDRTNSFFFNDDSYLTSKGYRRLSSISICGINEVYRINKPWAIAEPSWQQLWACSEKVDDHG